MKLKFILLTILSVFFYFLQTSFAVGEINFNWKLDAVAQVSGNKCLAYSGKKLVKIVIDNNEASKTFGEEVLMWSNYGGYWEKTDIHSKKLYTVIWGNNEFIATGQNKAVFKATTGIKWTNANTNLTADLTKIIFYKSQYYAVDTEGNFLSSMDAQTWQIMSKLPITKINGLAAGDNGIVVVSDNGIILHSPDGVKWSKIEMGNEVTLYNICYSGSRYAVIASNAKIFLSDNGTEWQKVEFCFDPSKDYDINGFSDFNSIVWDGKSFVLVGSNGAIFHSGDGEIWEKMKSNTRDNLISIASNVDRSFILGEDGTILKTFGNAGILIIDVGQKEAISKVIYQHGYFLGVGRRGTISSSVDGILWMKEPSEIYNDLNDVMWDGKKYIVVGGGAILTSTDNYHWTNRISKGGDFTGICKNDNTYIVVGREGLIYSSEDGENWRQVHINFMENFRSVAWGKNNFVAVGDDEAIYQSPDGLKWYKCDVKINWNTNPQLAKLGIKNTLKTINSITWAENQFIAVGMWGLILTSSDGKVWTQQKNDINNHLNSIVNISGKNFALGFFGTILVSENGVNWSDISLDTKKLDYSSNWYLTSLVLKDGKWLLMNDIGEILISTFQEVDNMFVEYLKTTRSLVDKKNYTEGIVYADKAINISPDSILALILKAQCLHNISKPDEAIETLKKILELNPNNSDVMYNIASEYSLKGETLQALDYLKKAIAIDEELKNFVISDTDFDNVCKTEEYQKSAGITVYVDGELLDFDVTPKVLNGRTMIPFRRVLEAIGANVSWDDSKKQLSGKLNSINVVMNIGSNEAIVNGEIKKLEVSPIIEKGRTLIPLRFVAEALCATVNWNDELKIIEITTKDDDEKISQPSKEQLEKIKKDTDLVVVDGAVFNAYDLKFAESKVFFVAKDKDTIALFSRFDKEQQLKFINEKLSTRSFSLTTFELMQINFVFEGKSYLGTKNKSFRSEKELVLERYKKGKTVNVTVQSRDGINYCDYYNPKYQTSRLE